MAKNRKAAQDLCLSIIDEMLPGGENKKIYEDLFSKMSDAEFDKWMTGLERGTIRLSVVSPNYSTAKIDVKRNIGIAKKLGHNFFQRVWIPPKGDTRGYLTPIPYMVVELPLRRQAQILNKKISIPEDNNSVDHFTGQATGKSKGAKISYPETQVIAAMGMDACLQELLKFRGGDERGFSAMNTMIDRTGRVSLKEIQPYTSGVKSIHTLKMFLNAAHLKSTL